MTVLLYCFASKIDVVGHPLMSSAATCGGTDSVLLVAGASSEDAVSHNAELLQEGLENSCNMWSLFCSLKGGVQETDFG